MIKTGHILPFVFPIMSEVSPLIPDHQHPSRRFKYRFVLIRSRAAVFVLIWDCLLQTYKKCILYLLVVLSGILSFNGDALYLSENLFHIPLLFYPVGGLIADVWIGRYRMIVISGYICLVAWLFTVIGFSFHWYLHGELYIPVSGTILIITICLFISGTAGFQSNILPFNIDQMMGASGDQLSAVIHWHMFGTFVSLSTPTPAIKSLSNLHFLLACLIISTIAIILIIISYYIFKRWLDTTPQITNPIKLIVIVLNYARKNKYPRNRSALTYWEEDYPLRLDLGKAKYGGPFSEEEVEDVKTVLRLLPLFICVVGFPVSWGAFGLPIDVSGFGDDSISRYVLLYVEEYRIPLLVCSVSILLYQFIIYPCFYKYIPSMLKRIGLGLVFALLTSIFYFIILIVGDFSDPSFECTSNIGNHSNTSAVMVVNYKWLLIPHITYGCTLFLVVATTLEFTVAQSPRQMRGLMVGISYATYAMGRLMTVNGLFLLFRFKSLSRGCILYYHLGSSSFILFTLIVFVIYTKRYKLRVRDNIVPVHQIAEEHYERYIKQREEREREGGSFSIQ